MKLAFALPTALWALTACSPATPCAGGAADASVTVGQGDPANPTFHRVLTSGDRVVLVPGNQGGQHVWVQIRATDICPDRPKVRLTTYRDSDGVVIGLNQFTSEAWTSVADSPGGYGSPPYASSIEQDRYCSVLHGGRIRIVAQVDDGKGHVVEGTITVVVDGWSPDALQFERAARDACCADMTNLQCWPNGPADASTDAPADASIDAGDGPADSVDASSLDSAG